MIGVQNSLLALLVLGIGVVGLILSFIVPDPKKSKISLILALIIMALGLYHLGSQAMATRSYNARVQELRRQNQTDIKALREKLQNSENPNVNPAQNTP